MRLEKIMDEMQMDFDDVMLGKHFGDLITPSDGGGNVRSSKVPFNNACRFSDGNEANETSAKRLSAVDEDFENLLKCEPCLLDPRLLQLRSSTSAPCRYGENELTVPKSNCLGNSTPSLSLVGDNRPIQDSLRHQSLAVSSSQRDKQSRNARIDVVKENNLENNSKVGVFEPCMQAFPIGPPLSLKQTNMTSRTQMRQHLQKLQTHDEEERNKQMVMNQQLNAPSSLPSEPLNIQSFIPPAAEVPIQILQVRSQLENPTRYHVVKCQQRQVKEYLTGKEMAPVTTRSLPSSNAVAARTATNAFAGGRMVTAINLGSNNAVHFNDPNSPQSAATLESSAATSVASDVDDIWELINSENMTADDSEHSSTVPNLGIFGDVLNLQPMNGKTSSSCPADLPPIKEDLECPISDAQYKALVKDRQKKDTHNMIERRRRFNINDRIKELGDLLPKNNERYYELVRDVKQNKGTILKASVDYIKKLKDEVRRMKNSEERQRQLEQNNRELLLRIRDLEDQLGVPSSETTWRAASINQIMNVLIKQEPDTLPLYKQECDTSPAYDLMEEDYSAINGDPMLSSPPDGSTGSTNLDDTLSHDSMDLLP